MVYGPAGYPKGLLDPDFFTREAKQLNLPPELLEKFKVYSNDLAEQFHLAVENAVKECKQQAVHASPNQMVQKLRHASNELETKLNALTDQAHSDLLDLAGTEHAKFIDLFIQDLHKELSPHADIEGKLRLESETKGKLPPKSIFELSGDASKNGTKRADRTKVQAASQAGGQDPVESYYQKILAWQKQFPVDEYGGGYGFAKRIIDYINGNHGPKPQSLSDILNFIYTQLYTSSKFPNCDVYVFFASTTSPNNDLTQANLESLADILQDPISKPPLKLTVPQYTQMDQFISKASWLYKNYPNDPSLFIELNMQLLGLGSSDNNLEALKKWALTELQSSKFLHASAGAQKAFCDLFGLPLPGFAQYINGITQWEQQFAKNSPQYALGEKIKNIIFSLEGKTDKLSDILAQIYSNVYVDPKNPGQDIYMLFSINNQQLSDLGKILTQNGTTLQIPGVTQMDQTYLDSYNWLQGLTSDPDKALAGKLLKEIQSLGSNGQLSALTSWAQGLINNKDSVYTSASAEAQAQFQIITGASDATGLGTFEKEIQQYLAKRQGDLAQWLQWLSSNGIQPPQSDAQWRRFAEQTTVLYDDIQYAIGHPGNWGSLAAKYGLNPNGDIQKEAEALLNGRQQVLGAHESTNLFTSVLNEIKSLEASKGTLADLKKWAQTVNINTKDYSYLTGEDFQEFDKMLQYSAG